MEGTVRLYSFSFRNIKTYLFAFVFVIGNIVLPQVCHLINAGGLIWLPIYFFTLIAAYKYGLRVGLLTAILSPLVNSFFFGMPMPLMLPVILVKSTLFAIVAAYAARFSGKVSIFAIIGAVLAYQTVGTLIEWTIVQNFYKVIQDFHIGIPGMLLQIFGGYALLKAIAKI
jgi:hypothetical protein